MLLFFTLLNFVTSALYFKHFPHSVLITFTCMQEALPYVINSFIKQIVMLLYQLLTQLSLGWVLATKATPHRHKVGAGQLPHSWHPHDEHKVYDDSLECVECVCDNPKLYRPSNQVRQQLQDPVKTHH